MQTARLMDRIHRLTDWYRSQVPDTTLQKPTHTRTHTHTPTHTPTHTHTHTDIERQRDIYADNRTLNQIMWPLYKFKTLRKRNCGSYSSRRAFGVGHYTTKISVYELLSQSILTILLLIEPILFHYFYFIPVSGLPISHQEDTADGRYKWDQTFGKIINRRIKSNGL